MKINRVFLALMATLLLPVTAMAQLIPTPQPGTAVIAVSVFFDNGDDETPVTLHLQCTSGSISPSAAVVVNPQFGSYEHAFVISQIPGNTDNVCTVTQSAVAGYETAYECGTLGYSSLSGECDGTYSDDACTFDDIQIGDVGGCLVRNNVEGVEFVVTKVWDVSGAAGDYYDLDAEIKITCDDVVGMEPGYKKYGKYRTRFELEDGDYEDGVATVTVMVYPEYDGSECWAEEDDVDSAVEVDDSDCQSVDIGVGSGGECTITNTLFFEGIPTLNQYGMAIMALLMLGVGFVGFRRFV
jgi:hypothetical protein